MVAASVVHGIHYAGFPDLLVAGLLLGFLNAFVKPILVILTLPFLILTLGLFTLVINALMLYGVGHIMRPSSFQVDSFSAAFWGGLVISIVSMLLNAMIGGSNQPPRGGGRRGRNTAGEASPAGGPVIDV